jgi:hypothetical protein
MADVKQAIYNTIYNLLDALDDERPVSEKMRGVLEDLKEDFPEIYSSVLETRYCERHDI